MYKKLEELPIFTEKAEIESIIGLSQFSFNENRIHYYSDGLLVAYAPRRFIMKDAMRAEYGEVGEYAVRIYHYNDMELLKKRFRLASFDYDYKPQLDQQSPIIKDIITYNHTFNDVHRMKSKLKQLYQNKYLEGETRVLEDGKTVTQNLFIMCGNYKLFFAGDSKKSKISGFEFVLKE